MKKLQNLSEDVLKYGKISRRSFLKGAMAVGGALALAGCGDTQTDTKTTIVPTTTAESVDPTVPTVPDEEEIVNLVTHNEFTILPKYEQCSGCRICEWECGYYHYGLPQLADSNIKVYVHDINRGTVDIPILCVHCLDAFCMAACPDKVAAISLDEVSGCIRIDHDKCTLCELCIEACKENSTGCLRLESTGEKVIGACDFCDGNPSCVKYCPEGTLTLMSKRIDGHWFAGNSYDIAPRVYAQIFGDYYTYLQKN